MIHDDEQCENDETSSSSYMEVDNVVIEEITDTNDLAENELSQFVPTTIPFDTTTLQLLSATTASTSSSEFIQHQNLSSKKSISIPAEEEEMLIKKLISGEMTFLDYNQQIGRIVDDDDINVDEQEDGHQEFIDDDDIVDEENDDNNDSQNSNDKDEIKHATENDEGNIGDDMDIDHKTIKKDETTLAKIRAGSSKNFENELLQSRRDAIRGNYKGRTINSDGRVQKRRCVLPVALQGLMGEANLCYARGQTQLAETVCLEIIRQVPLAPEPFLTLAQIYESNPDKYMQFSLIAAHLKPNDYEQWVRVAQMSIEQGNIKQAINCYTKATKYNPKNLSLRLKRIELLKMIGEDKLAFRSLCYMLPHIPLERGDYLLETAKSIANQLLQENSASSSSGSGGGGGGFTSSSNNNPSSSNSSGNVTGNNLLNQQHKQQSSTNLQQQQSAKESNLAKALEAITTAYKKVPQLFQTEDIHFYLEILMANCEFKTVLDVLSNNAGVQYKINESDQSISTCEIPNEIILDFRSKLIVSLVHLKVFHLLDQLIENIFTFIDVEDAGDCYLDVAEALMKENRFNYALRLLVPLVNSTNFSLAAVWLRHADCLRAIGNLSSAIESYKQVVELAPQHYEARLTLSALLKQSGESEQAMRVLEQDMANELIDPYVLYERCLMLKELKNYEKYVDVGFLLLSRHCIRLRNREEIQIATTIVKFSTKLSLIRDNRAANSEPITDSDGPVFAKTNNEPTVLDEWKLFQDIVLVACEQQRFPIMAKIVFTMMTARPFLPYQKDLEFLAMLAALYNRDAKFAYLFVKELVVRHLDEPRVWNLFNVVLQFTEDVRYSRFLLRLFKRTEKKFIHPTIIRANYWLLSGSYKYAINDYVSIYNVTKDPLIALLLSVTYAHMAQQKYMSKKHSLFAQSLSFCMQYRDNSLPEVSHEVHYNLGRLHHLFGILHLAIWHYNEVLRISGENKFVIENPDILDLRRQAAFNMHLIYNASGHADLARKCLYEFIVV